MWKMLKKNTKIAITGTGASGKTMFLTSLIWHLREWRENTGFRVGKQVKISNFRSPHHRRAPDDVFPFNKYQDALTTKGEWPAKTKDVQQYKCEYQRNDLGWPRSGQHLELIDLPGERIADAGIMAYEDFGEWSDDLFTHFEHHSEYEAGRQFKAAVEAGHIRPEAVVGHYRHLLAEFTGDCKPLITPSVFVLDQKGELAPRPDTGEAWKLAEKRLAGLDANSQFAPLPESFREQHPELAEKMREHYKRYRKEVAIPYFNHLASSDSLIVLVDIPFLLLGDVARFNDTRKTIENLFSALDRESAIGRRLLQMLRNLSLSSLRRVAFVATKADLVARQDWKNNTLKSLLREMTRRAVDILPAGVKVEWFICSACVSTVDSTKAGANENRLQGVPLHGNPSRELREYAVTSLPDVWPENWHSGEFNFRDVYPKLERNPMYPPKHYQLDAVFDFVAPA